LAELFSKLPYWDLLPALAGGRVAFVNPARYEYLFDVAGYFDNDDLIAELERLLASSAEECRAVVTGLKDAAAARILLGQIAQRHPRFAEIRALAASLAQATGASLGYVTEGANTAGLSLAGALPHREAGGASVAGPGASASEIIANPPRGLVLFGAEPEADFADRDAALRAAANAEFVVALSPFLGDGLNQHASVVLPMGTYAETSGTYVNAAGDWQSFNGVAQPVGDCRPGWKILRVLGNLLELPGCGYDSSTDIVAELRSKLDDDRTGELPTRQPSSSTVAPIPVAALDVPMYQVDALVRRSASLQQTQDARGDAPDERKIA
jgi:NADH-quinone oxidoreductase subunit G